MLMAKSALSQDQEKHETGIEISVSGTKTPTNGSNVEDPNSSKAPDRNTHPPGHHFPEGFALVILIIVFCLILLTVSYICFTEKCKVAKSFFSDCGCYCWPRYKNGKCYLWSDTAYNCLRGIELYRGGEKSKEKLNDHKDTKGAGSTPKNV